MTEFVAARKLKRSLTVHLGTGTNVFAELSAIKASLSLCYQLGFYDHIVESDALLVVTWYKNKKSHPCRYVDLWEHILDFNKFLSSDIQLIYREDNGMA